MAITLTFFLLLSSKSLLLRKVLLARSYSSPSLSTHDENEVGIIPFPSTPLLLLLKKSWSSGPPPPPSPQSWFVCLGGFRWPVLGRAHHRPKFAKHASLLQVTLLLFLNFNLSPPVLQYGIPYLEKWRWKIHQKYLIILRNWNVHFFSRKYFFYTIFFSSFMGNVESALWYSHQYCAREGDLQPLFSKEHSPLSPFHFSNCDAINLLCHRQGKVGSAKIRRRGGLSQKLGKGRGIPYFFLSRGLGRTKIFF